MASGVKPAPHDPKSPPSQRTGHRPCPGQAQSGSRVCPQQRGPSLKAPRKPTSRSRQAQPGNPASSGGAGRPPPVHQFPVPPELALPVPSQAGREPCHKVAVRTRSRPLLVSSRPLLNNGVTVGGCSSLPVRGQHNTAPVETVSQHCREVIVVDSESRPKRLRLSPRPLAQPLQADGKAPVHRCSHPSLANPFI